MELIERREAPGDPIANARALETGNILYFPQSPIKISEEDRATLLATGQSGGHLHKNISYKPLEDRVSGVETPAREEAERVRNALRNYSRNAIHFLEEALSPYKEHWRVDYASYRSIEEEGRDLPWKKRNDLLHTDAFPTRPTRGDMILRIFTNINPSKERVWMTADPFANLAERYAAEAGLQQIAASASPLKSAAVRFGRSLGLPLVDRSPYDAFMLAFHDFLKASRVFQEETRKYRFSFPPGSTWIAFTDVTPHAVLSGRCALEQTMIIARGSLVQPDCAPIAILEKMTGARLA